MPGPGTRSIPSSGPTMINDSTRAGPGSGFNPDPGPNWHPGPGSKSIMNPDSQVSTRIMTRYYSSDPSGSLLAPLLKQIEKIFRL